MKTRVFKPSRRMPIRSGGYLEAYGWVEDSREVVIFLSRENFTQDDWLFSQICGSCLSAEIPLIRYYCRYDAIARAIAPPWQRWFPSCTQKVMKSLELLLRPWDWQHFSRHHRAVVTDIGFRSDLLAEVLEFFPNQEIHLLARSAGSIVATQARFAGRLSSIACLGYPFRHPERGDEPQRYQHLACQATPTLILQGIHDPYGSGEIGAPCELSGQIRLLPVATDHDFRIPAEQWQAVFGELRAFWRGNRLAGEK